MDGIKEYETLIRQVCYQFLSRLPANIEIDDLLQVARISVWDSIPKFDPSREVKIESYLSMRIKGAITDYLRDLDILSRGAPSSQGIAKV